MHKRVKGNKTGLYTKPSQAYTGARNNEHALRADVIMRDMGEMLRGFLEIQAEGRTSQKKI